MSMEKERVRLKFKKVDEPKLAKVSVLNNNETEYRAVIAILMGVFNKSVKEASEICKEAHTTGSGYIGVYTKELADTLIGIAKDVDNRLGFDVEEV